MGEIFIQNIPDQGVTTISNEFIDSYMLRANGEFVKVYLYLLRITQNSRSISLSSIADAFDYTERDILRALRYWEKAGLLILSFENQKLTGVSFASFPVSKSEETATVCERSSESDKPNRSEKKIQPLAPPNTLTAERKKELQEKEEVSQFLYIAEQYLGRTLSKTDIDNLLYFYTDLHFNAELIEYLVEYCVSKGGKSSRYIETVALSWASEGITTVQEAKNALTLHNKNYFTILKALGIKGRNPIPTEQKMMDQWLNEMGFSLDMIEEACQRTVLQTGQSSFRYVDSILRGWYKKGVRCLTDLTALDEEHRIKKSSRPQLKTISRSKPTEDYPHRSYDYDEIKKSLFNQ